MKKKYNEIMIDFKESIAYDVLAASGDTYGEDNIGGYLDIWTENEGA